MTLATLCVICAAVVLPLVLLMFGIALFGEMRRAQGAANAIDESVNCILGGGERETISRRTGLAVIAGKRWGICLAPVIDFFFGAGHCHAKAIQ